MAAFGRGARLLSNLGLLVFVAKKSSAQESSGYRMKYRDLPTPVGAHARASVDMEVK